MALVRYDRNGNAWCNGPPKINYRPGHHNNRRVSRWTYDDEPMKYIYALPYNRSDVQHHRARLQQDIENFALRCKELSTPYNPLQIEDLIEVFDRLVTYVLCALQADGDEDFRVGDELLQDIEQRARHDKYAAMLMGNAITRDCQHYFRILAEISRHCSSSAIAEVLYYFLSCHHRFIVEHNTTLSLEQWVRAVLISHMHPSEKRECIYRLTEREPEIVERMLSMQSDGVRTLHAEAHRVLHAVATGGYLADPDRDRSEEYWPNHSGYGGAERERDERKLSLREDIDHHKKQLQRKKQELKDIDRRSGRSGYGPMYGGASSRIFRSLPWMSDD